MRTFIAIAIHATPTLLELQRFLEVNGNGMAIRYTLPSQYHLTLSFLGETSQDQMKYLMEALNNKACSCTQFTIDLTGLGVFKNHKVAHTLWIGTKPSGAIETLHTLINEIIIKQGFTCESKSYSPHLTLGRIKRLSPDNNLDWIVKQFRGRDFGKVIVDKFIFYESILTDNGPVYKPLQYFNLQQSPV